MKRLIVIFVTLVFCIASVQGTVTAQGISLSSQTQKIKGKEYYVHIVEKGQTLFSISRAYGLKYYDAVIKTDIHLMQPGDTVWLPKNELSMAAVGQSQGKVKDEKKDVHFAAHYVKVEAGQTLYGIAREYGITVEDLVKANPDLNNEQLKAGQMLRIPEKDEFSKKNGSDVSVKKEESKEPVKKVDPVKKEESKEPLKKNDSTEITKDEKSGERTDSLAVRRPVENPYPFAEVPSVFPKEKAPFLTSSTPSKFPFRVRDRQDKNRLFVTVMLPLYLNRIDGISTSKFDIEQRGKKEYKSFEFIQFYEGILMALYELEERGVSVVLNVVDMTSDKEEDVAAAFESHNVANSDFVIALLVKKPFEKLAALAKEHQVMVINPFSSRVEVVADNPYVVKCMPSTESTVKSMLDIVASKHKGGQLYIIHSNNKSLSSEEHLYKEEILKQLEARKDIKYTLFDWSANNKLLSTLKTTNNNVILSIYDQGDSRNNLYATTLLNRLSSTGKETPRLMTISNYLEKYHDLDFDQLQHVNYTMVTIGHLDYDNPLHKRFVDTYKEKFRTEPNSLYAGTAHDIMLYFATALWQKGAEFWRNPQTFNSPSGLLFPFGLKQRGANGGYENQCPDIYQMFNYKLIKIR
ncbi:MAG: LysM peptidoglycan-binding domain-containing protein [Bacteroidales bacterium]|nr:LysM peptidoglycan-binding domain-containing protein [Bacteroidales bacterium]